MTPIEQMMAEAHERTKRELKVLKASSAGTIRMQRVTIAALKKERAKLRREWAGVEGDYAELRLAIAMWESRTGLNHGDVLEGVYGAPWGIASHKVQS